MTRDFAIHFQDSWHEKAGNPKLPLWLRVAAYAYGSHASNGHASFDRGEVADVLTKVNRDTGEVATPSDPEIVRAIGTAVAYHWLDPRSTLRCLVVPAHQVQKRTNGQMKVCPQQSRHDAQHRRRVREERHLKAV